MSSDTPFPADTEFNPTDISDDSQSGLEARALAESLIAQYGFHAEIKALRVASEAERRGDSQDMRLWSEAFNAMEEIRAERGISIVRKNMANREVGAEGEASCIAYKIFRDAGANAETYVLELIDTSEREGRVEDARKLTVVLNAIELLHREMTLALAQPMQ